MINNDKNDGFRHLQALFRGKRCRDTHVKRAKEGNPLICPYAKSSTDVITKMLMLGKCNEHDIVYDLGCGDGSILLAVAVNHGSNCYGYDIDSILCSTARNKAIDNGVSHLVTILDQDILTVDCSIATVIFMFLVPSCLEYLSANNLKNCKTGTRIVCYKFPLPGS